MSMTVSVAYMTCRAGLTVFAAVMAFATLRYAIQTRASGRSWWTGLAGSMLLFVAAALSGYEVYASATPDEPTPVPVANWVWLFGFDLLLPIWAMLLLSAWRRRDAAYHAVEVQALTDPLTGVMNRRGFIDAAYPAITIARRSGVRVSVAMLDIDRFKLINDGFGHDVGDDVLRGIGATLRAELRAGDVLGRMGGEEFALVLLDATPEQAARIAERMREAVRQRTRHPAGPGSAITLSAGVAGVAFSGEVGMALEAALTEADGALYEAKQAGRDRVVVHTDARVDSAEANAR